MILHYDSTLCITIGFSIICLIVSSIILYFNYPFVIKFKMLYSVSVTLINF